MLMLYRKWCLFWYLWRNEQLKNIPMYKIILSIVLVIFNYGCSKEASLGSISNIENDRFREFVLSNFDVNADGALSRDEMMKVREIDCSGLGISTLKGIEIFPNLKTLKCNNNYMYGLDVSRNKKLEELNCASNRLSELNLSSNYALKTLYCSNNRLKVMDITNNTNLTFISCKGLPLLYGADKDKLEIYGDKDLRVMYK